MKAYWFSREDGTTEHLNTPAKVGQTDTFNGTPVPCVQGFHGSPTPWDALGYACGPVLWIVDLGGEIVPHSNPIDKHVAQSRKYLFRLDVAKQLRMFSAQCALGVFDKWDPPEVVREYIKDEARGIDRSDIRDAAWAAAWDAARAAAWDAAWAAAWAAVRDAARAAAWAAARAAAWDAAWAAARAAARDAARDAQRENFNHIIADVLLEAGWED